MASKAKATTTTTAPTTNGNLPKGWRIVRFGDVVRDVNEAERNPLDAGLERFVGLEHIEPENLHLKQWGLLADGEISFTKRFRKGQVLFGKRRAYQRKVAVAEFDGICSSDILTFEPKNDLLIPELLPFIVQSDGFFEYALGTSSGSLSPRTRWSQLQDYEFRLPPKDEQRRIADILWAADEVKVRYQNSLSDFQRFYDNTADGIFGECDNQSKLLGNLCDLGDLDIQTGPFGTVLQASSYVKVGTPIINPVNMVKHALITSNGPFLDQETCKRLVRYQMNLGDILLGRKGDVGRAVFVTSEYSGFIVGSDLIRLRLESDVLEQLYLYYFLLSPKTRSWIFRHASGTTMPGINEKLLRSISIPIPSLEKQREVLQKFEMMNAAEAVLTNHLQYSACLLVGLINNMTEGDYVQ